MIYFSFLFSLFFFFYYFYTFEPLFKAIDLERQYILSYGLYVNEENNEEFFYNV